MKMKKMRRKYNGSSQPKVELLVDGALKISWGEICMPP